MRSQRVIYLDHAATTPLDPRVAEAMRPYEADVYGNSSSLHSLGRAALAAVDKARQTCADILGCSPTEIVFTASATESINLALRGIVWASQQNGRAVHAVSTPVEHHAVSATLEQLGALFGLDVTLVPVDECGRADPDDVGRALRDTSVLVSVMYANNEIGTLQPLSDIARIAHSKGVLVHTDAVQAGGALDLNVDRLGVDSLALSAHKFYGPKGAGLMYVRAGTSMLPALTGGGHERGRRPGTLNVAGIVGLAAALCLAQEARGVENERLVALRDRLAAGLLERVPDMRVTGHPTQRLPNHISFAVKDVEGELLVMALDLEGICVSSGSACVAAERQVSLVLTAAGWDSEWAVGSLRMTLGRVTTDKDVDVVLDVFPGVVQRLRSQKNLRRLRL